MRYRVSSAEKSANSISTIYSLLGGASAVGRTRRSRDAPLLQPVISASRLQTVKRRHGANQTRLQLRAHRS